MVSDAVRRLNEGNPDLGRLSGEKPQRKLRPSLDKNPGGDKQGRSRMARSDLPVLRILIIGFREKVLDQINFAAGAKHLQDQIARSLGLDDGTAIEWEYEQIRTRGKTGVLVRIEEL